jgi:L-threonylcarbamoyladenylate synthase
VPVRDDGSRPAPGTLASHYAPRAEVVLVAEPELAARAAAALAAGARVGLLAPAAPRDLPDGVELLVAPRDPAALARQLYALLRAADERGLDVLLAIPPPSTGLGAAVADRLRRAAATEARRQ